MNNWLFLPQVDKFGTRNSKNVAGASAPVVFAIYFVKINFAQMPMDLLNGSIINSMVLTHKCTAARTHYAHDL